MTWSTPFVVLLFIIVIFGMSGGLIVVYFRSKAKANATVKLREGDVGFERENRLFSLFQNIEDMMSGFESYVEETRAAFEMEKVEFLRMKEEINRMNAQVSALLMQFQQELAEANERIATPPSTKTETEVRISPPKDAISPSSARAASIWTLYREGKTGETIAKELGIAQNEVNLTLRVLLGDQA